MPRPRPKFSDYEYLLVGCEYEQPKDFTSVNNKIIFTCEHGHEYILTIWQIKSGKDPKACPFCEKEKKYNQKRLSYSQLENELDLDNFSITNKKDFYSIWGDQLNIKCKKCGHNNKIRSLSYFIKNKQFSNFKCENCLNVKNILSDSNFNNRLEKLKHNKKIFQLKKEFPIKDIPNNSFKEKYLKQKDWLLLSYHNTKHKATFQCLDCGATKETYPHNLFIKGGKCLKCKNDSIKENIIDDIKHVCYENDIFPVNEDFYVDCKTSIEFRCNKCGEIFYKKWKDKSYGFSCPSCKRVKSKTENEFAEFVSTIYKEEIIRNDRKQIQPYELDVYLPECNLAFEYCGNIWHSDKYTTHKNSHKLKQEMCEKKGIRLITIFEDEWLNKRDICETRIKNTLNLIDIRIYARKCEIKEIDNKTALKFCGENHIQGRGQANYSYGLYYEEKLVSVMTFSKPSVSKNAKGYDFELNRFCSLKGCTVVGGANKLLNKFSECNKGKILVTFCDLRWGTGNVYEKMGFHFICKTDPNYYYVGNLTNWERKHRFNFTKKKLVEIYNKEGAEKLSESKLSEKLGLHRIYDCGHLKFSKKL